jgi:hypothetical protein
MPQLNVVRKELPAFQGVNLRQDRLSLADVELAKAINADLHTFVGVVTLRYGRRKLFSSALTDLVIRRMAKINTYRYRVAGQSVYRDETRIINGLLSDRLVSTLFAFRPLNDDTNWAFIADSSRMRKDNGTTVYIWGIRQPTTVFSIAEGEGDYGTDNDTAVVTYNFIRFSGASVAAEGNPATNQTHTFTADDTGVAIGDVEDPGSTTANGFGFYRSVINGTSPLLDTRVSFGSHATWNNPVAFCYDWEAALSDVDLGHHFTYNAGNGYRATQQWEGKGTSNSEDASGYHATHNWEIVADSITQALRFTFRFTKEDSELGTAVETDNDVPPNAAWGMPFQEHVFLCRDPANPHYLWYSKRFLPEAFPVDQFLELGNPDDPLQCALPNAGLLGVLSLKTKYRVAGNAVSGFVGQEALSKRGTPAPMACMTSEQGIVFPARDGIFLTNLITPDQSLSDDIQPIFYGETVNDMLPINWPAILTAAAETIKGRYYFSYPSGASSYPDSMAVYSRDVKKWYFYDHPMTSLYLEDDSLLAGGIDGFVYVLEEGTTDAGTDIALDVQTRDFAGEERDTRKLFMYCRIDADTLAESLTVKFYVDGVLKRTTTISGTRNKHLLRLPEGCMGYQWRINATYTGSKRIKLYGATAFWLPLSAN